MSFEVRYSGREDWEFIEESDLRWLSRCNYQDEHVNDLLRYLEEGATIPMPDRSADVRAVNVFAEMLSALN